eukprot:Pgem_evm1s2801
MWECHSKTSQKWNGPIPNNCGLTSYCRGSTGYCIKNSNDLVCNNCSPGYYLNGQRCSQCPFNKYCVGGATPPQSCPSGYVVQSNTCVDINECSSNNGNCHGQATCTNTAGSHICTCKSGYSGNGYSCTDVNECASNNGGCHGQATCTNTAGSHTCTCKSGYSGNGYTCTDVNECASNNGGCHGQATCTNTAGSRTCTCKSGYSGNGLTCTDINECNSNNGGCFAGSMCINNLGAPNTCGPCPAGYDGDGRTCSSCPAGFYCPSGSALPCTDGKYCAGGLAQPADCSSSPNCAVPGSRCVSSTINELQCTACLIGFAINSNQQCNTCAGSST